MKLRRLPQVVAPVVVLVAVLAACGDDDDEDEPSQTTTALANPASVFCVEQGGEVEIVDEEGGQVGYCILPDGTRIEEWEYFEQQTGGTTVP